MAAPESLAVPPKDPFRTRRQLPRTPLSSKGSNRSRLPGSRARSASPGVTKIPRSSHIARSESPARASAGLGTPSGRSSTAAAGENLSTVTTPVADTRRVEEEMLAAFARTPKVARTPPKGSAPSAPSGAAAAATATAASLAREEPADERSTVQLTALHSAGAASAPTPAPHPAHPPPSAASTLEAREEPSADTVGAQGAPAAEPPLENVFGRSAKLSRTPPRSGGAAGVIAPAAASSSFESLQQQPQGLRCPQAAVHASASASVRSVQQPTVQAGGGTIGSSHGLASPSASADSSCVTAANVRSLLGSDSKTSRVDGSAARRGRSGGALTPAAFEGLISVMRTPSTGMKRRDTLVNEVPQMKSLDTVKGATTHRPANALRGQVPPRATSRAGPARPRYASSIEEAKAAAEAAAKATAAKKALAAAEAAIAAGASTSDATTSTQPAVASADDDVNIQASHAGPRPSSKNSPVAAPASGLLAPSAALGVGDFGTVVSGSVPAGEEVAAERSVQAVEKEHEAPAADSVPGITRVGGELTVDPFVRSQKLPRTPTPANTAPVKEATGTAASTSEVPAPSPSPSPSPHPNNGDNGGDEVVLGPESQPEAVTPAPPEGHRHEDGEGPAGATAVEDPFVSRSNIPRTPTDHTVPPHLSLFQEIEGVAAGGGGGGGVEVEAMDMEGAREQIRELNQELACKRDSLAKQAEERKRLADAAFEAQDEAAKLRQRLEEIQAQIKIQQQQKLNEDEEDGGEDDLTEGSSKGKGKDSGNDAAESGAGGEPHQAHGKDGEGEEGDTGGAGAGPGASAVELTAERVVQLEIEKWETEQGKREAEKETQRAAEAARQANAALDEAQTKVRELTLSTEARHEEMLAEELTRAREQCKRDERAIEEHQVKVKLFVADKRAEILRAQVSEEQRLKAEQNLRAAAVAVAGKACKVVQEFVARNARMSRRVAGLRANVEEREELVANLKERSALLEASGKSAQHETEEVRDLLAAATEELEVVKRSSEALEARLGPLEQECRAAQTAQENLRALVDAEEARRVSVEQRLSEVKRSGENVVGIERARRQSTERRLGLAERTRDELAAAAAAAAATALREAAETEKSRRMSVERRLEYAERARTELSATVAESAASAAAAAAAAAAASTAASEAAASSRSKDRGADAPPSGETPSPPAASAPVPNKKAAKAATAKKSGKKAEESTVVGDAAASPVIGDMGPSPAPKKVRKSARPAEKLGGDDGKDGKSTPAKAAQRREPSPSKKSAQTAIRAKPGRAKKATPATSGTTAGNSDSSSSSGDSSDGDLDGSDDVAAAPTRAEPAPTITTGRTGRKRKQINYAEPSPLLDRSVVAALSDSSDDEYDPPAPRSKKPAPAAPGRKKSRVAATATTTAYAGGAINSAAPATTPAGASSVQSGRETGEHEGEGDHEDEDEQATVTYKGKGKGKAKSTSSVPARAAGGSAAATPRKEEVKEVKGVNGGGKTAPVEAAEAASEVEKPEKKRRRSAAVGKKGENTPVDEASTGSKKARRKSASRASKAKAVEKPEQDANPNPAWEGGSAEAAGAAAGLLSSDLSPINPPQKRSRKLLGGGTSRCKTPKAKRAAAAAASRADDDGDHDDENVGVPPATNPAGAAAAAASSPRAVPSARVGVTGVVTGAGVGPKSGSSAAAAKKTASDGAGPGSGAASGGAAVAPAKPAAKPLKLSTNSILAMRGKSTMRTSLFKGFLDPKNGFKVPRLKAGALRR
eukprot:g1245.t1